jgi:predicted nucleotidyltransferase
MEKRDYSRVWLEREKEEKKKRARAIRKAKKVAQALKKKYGVEEVYLFGSLVWRPDFLWAGSDIDLLVKGLEDEEYFEILADISNLSHPFRVDLIPYQNAWPSVKKRVLKEGVRLD